MDIGPSSQLVVVVLHKDHERASRVYNPVEAVKFQIVASIVGPSTYHMLQLEVACRVSILVLVDALVDLCYLLALDPCLVGELLEPVVRGHFAEWVGCFWLKGVEVELPVLVLVLDAPLYDTLI